MVSKFFRWILLSSAFFVTVGSDPEDEPASILECPYHVALERNGLNWCSGVIVAIDKVLTAAHCLTSGDVVVRYGTDKVLTGGAVVGVSHVKLHPDYNPYTFDYDIAVLSLEENFKFTARSAPIPISRDILAGKRTSWFSGWEKKESGKKSLGLYLESASEISLDQCQKLWGVKLTYRMICFSPVGTTCHGDSGGALISATSYSLIGIVSWGPSQCSDPLPPVVFTKVAVLYNWIHYQIYINRRMGRSTASKMKFSCNPFY